jgi:hypothetical protein
MRRRGTIGMVVGALVGALGLAGTGLAQAGPGALYQVTAVETPVVAQDSNVREFQAWNGRVYFVSAGPGDRSRLWAHDPITGELTECGGLEGWSYFQILGTTARGVMLFAARPGVGTVLVRWGSATDVEETAVVAGIGESLSYVLGEEVGDRIFFRTDDRSLWVSDGTATGTSRVRRYEGWAGPGHFASASGHLVFSVEWELWVSDGTEAGTRMLLSDGQSWLDPLGAVDLASGVSIVALGRGLYRFDAATGTIVALTQERVVSQPLLIDGRVVYHVEGVGVRAWSEGSGSVTLLSTVWDQVELGSAGTRAVVAVEGGSRGFYGTDGTIEGTARIGDLPEWFNLWSITSDGSAAWAYGEGVDRMTGFRSDGTAAGTIELTQGIVGQSPKAAFGSLYTAARTDVSSDDLIGVEPYVTDEAGRGRLIADLAPAARAGLQGASGRISTSSGLWAPTIGRGVLLISGEPGDVRTAVNHQPFLRFLGSDGERGALGVNTLHNNGETSRQLLRWRDAGTPAEVLSGLAWNAFSGHSLIRLAVGDGVRLVSDGITGYLTDGTPEGTVLAFDDNPMFYYSEVWDEHAIWMGTWFAVRRGNHGWNQLWRVERNGSSRRVADYETYFPRALQAFGGRVWRTRGNFGDATGVWDSSDGEGGFVEVRGGLPLSWTYLGTAAGRWVFAELSVETSLTTGVWTATEGDLSLATMRRIATIEGINERAGLLGARVLINRGYVDSGVVSIDIVSGAAEALPCGFGDAFLVRAGERELAMIDEWTPAGSRFWVSDATAVGTRAVPGLPLRGGDVMGATVGRLFVTGEVDGLGRQVFAANLCVADFDGDGALTPVDYVGFVTAFESGEVRGDADGDGFIDWFDYAAYVEAFETGC